MQTRSYIRIKNQEREAGIDVHGLKTEQSESVITRISYSSWITTITYNVYVIVITQDEYDILVITDSSVNNKDIIRMYLELAYYLKDSTNQCFLCDQ